MPRRAPRPPTLELTDPAGHALVLRLVDVERDRAYGAELHVSTRRVRPKRMAAIWLDGHQVKALEGRLRALAGATEGSVALSPEAEPSGLGFSASPDAEGLVCELTQAGGRPAGYVRVRLDAAGLEGLLRFVGDVAKRL